MDEKNIEDLKSKDWENKQKNEIDKIYRYIRDLRKRKRMTAKDLALKSGLSGSYILSIENCKKEPSLVTLEKISKALDKEAWEILKEVNEHQINKFGQTKI